MQSPLLVKGGNSSKLNSGGLFTPSTILGGDWGDGKGQYFEHDPSFYLLEHNIVVNLEFGQTHWDSATQGLNCKTVYPFFKTFLTGKSFLEELIT